MKIKLNKKIIYLIILTVSSFTSKTFGVNPNVYDALINRDHPKVLEILSQLNDYDFFVDKKEHTALHIAVAIRDQKMVELLLEKGANPNIQDINKNTPIHTATYQNVTGILKSLLSNSKIKPDLTIKNHKNASAISYIGSDKTPKAISDKLYRILLEYLTPSEETHKLLIENFAPEQFQDLYINLTHLEELDFEWPFFLADIIEEKKREEFIVTNNVEDNSIFYWKE